MDMIRDRLHGHRDDDDMRAEGDVPEDDVVEIEPEALTGVFAAPAWLRDLGGSSWLLVGVAAFLAGTMWLLTLTQTIVMPVVTATILATVLSPIMRRLERRGMGRGLGTALVFGGVVVLAVVVVLVVVGGVSSQSGNLNANLERAADEIQGWLTDLGVSQSSAEAAKEDASSSLSDAFNALINGASSGIDALAGLVLFLSFAALSLVFLLKDGPIIRAWGERHLGVRPPVAHAITGRVITSLQGYFAGVTVVAAFNASVIGLAAFVLGVPLAGTIALVNFIAAYIPYLGAWTAGIFTVLIALGAEGPETALAMAVVALLANGILQQIVQPIAYGATLGLHPLAVLVVTVGAGAIFGTIGLVLSAPLTAAAVKISSDLARARAEDARAAATVPTPPLGSGGMGQASVPS